ncbi:MAG: hypothetical protein WA820_26040 [Bradyrhizobium sp.]|jgi:hypothetical protein
MLEIWISPCILIENRHVSPEATLKKPVESAPQLDNVPDVGHSEAACADGDGAKLGAATTNIKTMTFDDLILPPSLSLQKMRASMVVALIRIKATSALFWPSRDRSQLSPNIFRCYHSVTDFGRADCDLVFF